MNDPVGIKYIVNKQLTELIAGGGGGSILTLCFGKSFTFFIYCSWRLSFGDIVITGCHEGSSDANSPMVKGIKKIEGLILTDYIFFSDFDFSLIFNNGMQLSVFSDNTKNGMLDENWSFCNKENNQCVTLNSEFVRIIESFR